MAVMVWCFGALFAPLAVVAAQPPSPAAAQVQRAQASISLFDRQRSVDALDAALRSLEGAGSQRLGGNDRTTVAGGYLSLFAAIDRAMPRLPLGKVPKISVTPPRVKGVRYPSGISPSAIPDPAIRARYEQAIRDNEAFTERFLAAAALRRVDERAIVLFSDFAHDAFGASNADRAALNRQIEGSQLTRARKNQLLKAAGADTGRT